MRGVMADAMLGLVLLGIGAMTLIVVTGVVLWFATASSVQSEEAFIQSAARALQGKVVPGGFLSSDAIEFSLASRKARAEILGSTQDNRGRTSVQVLMDGPSPGTLHILREGIGQSFLKVFGAQDLEIGDPSFDADYVVKANPASLAARIFGPERRSRVIAAVRGLRAFDAPTIDLVADRLRIQVLQEIRSQADLMALVKTAGEFLEFLRFSDPPAGVELGEMRTSRGSACPVCGTGLSDPVVQCDTCKVPHHEECWAYVRQCSTYACRGKRCVT